MQLRTDSLMIICLLAAQMIPALASGEAIVYRRSSGLFGSDESITVPSNGSAAPSVWINSGVFATGAAAQNLSRAIAAQARAEAMLKQRLAEIELEQSKPKSTTPPEPRVVEIKDPENRDKLIGGMTELISESGIYITARHVLQEQELSRLKADFAHRGLGLNDYRFFVLKQSSRAMDVVLIVPKGKESQVLEFANPKRDCDGIERPVFQLRVLPQIERSVALNDRFYSFQFGTTGQNATTQASQGLVQRIGGDRIYLGLGDGNYTSSRSSGSIVFTSKKSDSEWKIGGIVECLIPPSVTSRGAPLPGAVQVISSSALLAAEIEPISIESLMREKVPRDADCIPIDGRDGGGK